MDIKQFIQKNREILIYGSIFAILLCVGIYLVLSGGEEKEVPSTYEVTLEEAEDESFEWGAVEVNPEIDSDITVLPTFKVSPLEVTDITATVNRLGFDGRGQSTGEGTYRFWGDDEEYARFNTITHDLIVNSSGLRLTEIERGALTYSEVSSYVNEFVDEYLGMALDIDIEVDNRYGNFQVTGSWTVGGYDIVHEEGQDYSLRAEFTSGGDLISLYVRPLVVTETGDSVDLVSVGSMNYYLREEAYPKEAYISARASAAECSFEDGCDPYSLYTLEGFSNVVIDTVSIVYYQDGIGGSSDLVPVYCLEGDGISASEDEVPVRVTIYANAIDPSRVVTPPEE